MRLKERISGFILLGEIMVEATAQTQQSQHAITLRALIDIQTDHNSWFTPANVLMAVESIGRSLASESISGWASNYSIPEKVDIPMNIGVIMAGNIPLVGFSDLLNVLISGNRIIIKSSSKDSQLIEGIGSILKEIEPGFTTFIEIVTELPESIDAVIATGSDNTSRYFEYRYGNIPHIFRKNRSSLSILNPDVSDSEIELLGEDIFSYFGMGCRNISKILIHKDFDIMRLKANWKEWSYIGTHKEWSNNYCYNRALLKTDNQPFIDGEFFLLRENSDLLSPICVVNYERYTDTSQIDSFILLNIEKIQCITGHGHIPFGRAQHPGLSDYADNVDTMIFLLSLNF